MAGPVGGLSGEQWELAMCPRCDGAVDMMSGICRSCGYNVLRPPDDQSRVRKALLFGLPTLAFVVWRFRDQPAWAIGWGVAVVIAIFRQISLGDDPPRT